MRMIYINGSRIPTEKAHGLQIMKMCEAFAIDGHEVELWVPKRLNFIKQDPFDYYGVEKIFKIKKIPCIDLVTHFSFLGPVAFWITELSFLFFSSFYLLRSREDIIYTRDKFVAFIFSFLKNNVFFEAHTDIPRIFLKRLGKIKGIIVITNNLKKIFQDSGISQDMIIVAPDGVDLEEFTIKETQQECRKKLSLPQDRKIVLYTGHLYPWKGVDVLLEAAKLPIFNYQFPNTLFVFVGGIDKDIRSFKEKARGLDNVKIVGHRLHKEIPCWLRAADVLVLPNSGKYDISKYWTSPLKLFEYMASGKPIVASDLPSIREILNEDNAVLVEPDNQESLAKGIGEVLRDGVFDDKISKQAFLDVENYTWSKRADSIIKFIQQSL